MNCQLLLGLLVALRDGFCHREQNSFDHPVDKLAIKLQ